MAHGLRSTAIVVALAAGCGNSNQMGPMGGNACTSARPPADTFSSMAAIQAANCLALNWHADAVLEGLDSGLLSVIKPDGTDAEWVVTYASPSDTATTAISFDVNSNVPSIMQASTSGTPRARGCTAGFPSLPVDSTVVVPVAHAKIARMTGVDTMTYKLSAQDHHDCGTVNGVAVNRQSWSVTGSWMQPDGHRHLGVVQFDSSGQVKGVHGPCLDTDINCLIM